MTDVSNDTPVSDLYDESGFYPKFLADLDNARSEVIIESPYITSKRMATFYHIFERLILKNILIYIITRSPEEHAQPKNREAESAIRNFERMGIHALLCTGNDHRKLAIIDRTILWEGSLNILSQSQSREVMRRFSDVSTACAMIRFLKLDQYVQDK
jgi:phosphatidylserine/phosphatidylglycerophosphate/cardiolipin synthase-like enzyme